MPLLFNAEAWWLHLCGTSTDASPESVAETFYWELFTDVLLVFALLSIQTTLEQEQNIQGFFEFSLFYFSIINGWFLYVHQYGSRFTESSRLNSVLVSCFLFGVISGILHASRDQMREFSLAMIVQRLAVAVMLAKIAIYIPRTGAFCALVFFFNFDVIICFMLAGADTMVAPSLWAFAALMEILVDLFLALGLQGSLFIPYNLKATMDRAWVLVWAPLGATLVSLLTIPYGSSGGGEGQQQGEQQQRAIVVVAALTLQILFCFLYYDFYEDALFHAANQSRFHEATLVILTKILGWAVWTVGASLLILLDDPTTTSSPRNHNILGWSVGCTLLLFLGLRLYAGRPHDGLEVLWVVAYWIPFAVVSFGSPTTPLVSLSMYLLVVSILNICESWSSMCTLIVSATTATAATTNPAQRTTVAGDDEMDPLLPPSSTSSSTTNRSYTVHPLREII
jgi:hypothetical protein